MLWFCYVLALALIIFAKVWNHKTKNLLSWGTVWKDFFFGTQSDGSSTYYTISILFFELVLGAWYIGDLPIPAQTIIPLHWTVALFLGSIAELLAVPLIKKVVDGFTAAASAIFKK